MAKYTTNLTLTTQHFSNDYLLLRMKIKLNKQQYTPQRIDKRSKIIKKWCIKWLDMHAIRFKKDWGEFQSKKRFPFRKIWISFNCKSDPRSCDIWRTTF